MSSTNSPGTNQLGSFHLAQAGDITTSHSHVSNPPPPTTSVASDEDENEITFQIRTPQQSILRHHDLWFDDGSIVLRAQNPTTLFRVHKAILARHSEVFRNMFAIPQPPRTRKQTQTRTPAQTPVMRQSQGLDEGEGLSSSWQRRTATHHRISKSVDSVKEPIVDSSNMRTMGSLSRKFSTLAVRTVFSMGPNPLATSRDYENSDDKSNGVDDDENSDYNEFHDSCDTDDAATDIDEANAERIEKCDVIDVHDSSGDVASLLHALYDGPQWTDNSPADFLVVSGVLRLAHKYLIDGLRSKALEHLHQAWPTTLQGWDLREDRGLAWSGGGSTGSTIVAVGQRECGTGAGLMGSFAEGRYPHPIHVISLARSTNALSLLPSAFYDLSRLTFSQIFDGMPTQSQELSSCDLQKLALGKEHSHQAITNLITNLGNVRCSITGGGGGSGVKIWCCALSNNGGTHSLNPGHAHSSHTHSRSLPSISRPKSYHGHCHSTCHSPVSCRRDFTELVELATQHYLFDREKGHTDPLYVAEELGQLKSSECSECKACAVALECWSMRERERIWRCLPGWFRVGAGWEGLE